MTVAVSETGLVVEIGNVADTAPAGTTTVAGKVATALMVLLSATTAPPTGAGLSRNTVPLAGLLPSTAIGESISPFSLRGMLKGARPAGNGLYRGSPVLRFIHFSQGVFLNRASPTFAPSNKLRK